MANEHQIRYGINIAPANLEVFQKEMIVKIMKAFKNKISTKAKVGFLNPKNKIDQKTFNNSWTKKKNKPNLVYLNLFSQTMASAIAIMK